MVRKHKQWPFKTLSLKCLYQPSNGAQYNKFDTGICIPIIQFIPSLVFNVPISPKIDTL